MRFLAGFTLACAFVWPVSFVLAGGSATRIDPAFGEHGVVLIPTGGSGTPFSANAVAQDREGRLVAVGGSDDNFVIARYLSDGTPDLSFGGGDGLVYEGDWQMGPHGQIAAATGVAVEPDGGMVVVGNADIPEGPRRTSRYYGILRLDQNGDTVNSFGIRGNGRILGSETQPFSVTLQTAGKILVGGETTKTGPINRFAAYVSRYLPTGRIDKSFGPKGTGWTRLVPRLNLSAGVLDSTVLPSGKILLSGYFDYRFMVARLTKAGLIDRNFGHGGMVLTKINPQGQNATAVGWGLARDQKQRIVVAGYVQPTKQDLHYYAALARYLPSGKLDQSFGKHGIVRTRLGGYAFARHVAIQRNGRIVVAAESGSPSSPRFTVLRYLTSGKLDRSFFGDGVLTSNLGSKSSARDVIIDTKGRLVVSGGAVDEGAQEFLLMRLIP